MVKITFITPSDQAVTVDVPAAGSVMEAARDHDVPGILADCGGSMVCGTCHVVVPQEWEARLPAQSEMEREMLEYVPDPQPHTRLTCQIPVSAELDGLVVRIPAQQR